MTKFINITQLWQHSHAHLQPFEHHIPLNRQQLVSCPTCDNENAFKIVIQARYGEDNWERAEPIYCPSCQGYVLPQPENAEPVNAINARLWSTAPTFLNIEPTTRCNFKCWYCVGRHMVQDDINVDNFIKLLDNFPTVQTIALVGEGEPLMHKGFFKMANLARARGKRVMIVSNGSTLSQSNIRKLCESGITYVSISIDSVDAETFASSRIEGKLDQIWKGIENLRRYRDEHGYQYPKIGLKGTLFSYSKNDLPEIVAAAKHHGVEIFESFQPLNPMSTYLPIYPEQKLEEIMHIDEIAACIARDSHIATQQLTSVAEFCEQEGIVLDKNGTPNGIRKNCDEQWIYSLLSGDITPCCQIKTPPSSNWNLFTRPIDQILSDQYYENMRFNLWNGIFPESCSGCWKLR